MLGGRCGSTMRPMGFGAMWRRSSPTALFILCDLEICTKSRSFRNRGREVFFVHEHFFSLKWASGVGHEAVSFSLRDFFFHFTPFIPTLRTQSLLILACFKSCRLPHLFIESCLRIQNTFRLTFFSLSLSFKLAFIVEVGWQICAVPAEISFWGSLWQSLWYALRGTCAHFFRPSILCAKLWSWVRMLERLGASAQSRFGWKNLDPVLEFWMSFKHGNWSGGFLS